jgi:hypothetical protein
MKKTDMFKVVAVMTLMVGSVAMAGDAVDVTPRADAHRAVLTSDANSGPSGIEVEVRNGDRVIRSAAQMREKVAQTNREMRRKPNPVNDRVSSCSDNPFLDLVSDFFGFVDVNPRCWDQ